MRRQKIRRHTKYLIGYALFLGIFLSACGGNSETKQISPPAPTTVYKARALLGPIVNANVDIFALTDLDIAQCSMISSSYSNNLELAGVIEIPTDCIAPDELHLIVVSGGEDVDIDDNGEVDTTPTPMQGKLHAFVSQAQLNEGTFNVNVLTELAYQRTKLSLLSEKDIASLTTQLSHIARQLLREDVNADGVINANDLGAWHPRLDQDKYARSPDQLASVISKLHQGEALEFDLTAITSPYQVQVDIASSTNNISLDGNDIIVINDDWQQPFHEFSPQIELLQSSPQGEVKKLFELSLPDDIYRPIHASNISPRPRLKRNGDYTYIAANYRIANYLAKYIHTASRGAYIADTSDPTNPSFSTFDHNIDDYIYQFFLEGNRLIALSEIDRRSGTNCLRCIEVDLALDFFDLSTPENPRFIERFTLDDYRLLAVQEQAIYITQQSTIRKLDTSDLGNVKELFAINLPQESSAQHLIERNGTLYLSVHDAVAKSATLHILDAETGNISAKLRLNGSHLSTLHLIDDTLHGILTTDLPEEIKDATIIASIDVSNLEKPLLLQTSQYYTPEGSSSYFTFNGRFMLHSSLDEARFLIQEFAVQPVLLSPTTSMTLANTITDFTIANDIAHISSGLGGYQLVDFGATEAPELIGQLPPTAPYAAAAVAAEGNLVILAEPGAGLRAIDIKDPRTPYDLGHILTHQENHQLLRDDILFKADSFGLTLVDYHNPASPRILTEPNPYYLWVSDLLLAGNLAYVSDEENGLSIFDIHDTENIQKLYSGTLAQHFPRGMTIEGDIAYMSLEAHTDANDRSLDGALGIVDISNSVSPSLLHTVQASGSARHIAQQGPYLYLSNSDSNLLDIIDISDTSQPRWLGASALPGYPSQLEVGANGLYISIDNTLLQFPLLSDKPLP